MVSPWLAMVNLLLSHYSKAISDKSEEELWRILWMSL